jgi:hypothetical protein
MDSTRSETFGMLVRLRESSRQGDWKNAQALAAALSQETVPNDPGELTEYLRLLKETVIAAKAWRSHANASLVRLNAAAKFHDTGRDTAAGRHDFGV